MKKIKLALFFLTTLVVLALANSANSAEVFYEGFEELQDGLAMNHFEIIPGPDNVAVVFWEPTLYGVSLKMDNIFGPENMVIESYDYDTIGLWDLKLSYDWWEQGAGSDEYIQVEVIDDTLDLTETLALHNPIGITDFEIQHVMLDLPIWTYDSSGVSIRFTLHSDDHGDILYLDNIILSGDPVPIPGAVWLLGSGLIGLAGFRRKYKK